MGINVSFSFNGFKTAGGLSKTDCGTGCGHPVNLHRYRLFPRGALRVFCLYGAVLFFRLIILFDRGNKKWHLRHKKVQIRHYEENEMKKVSILARRNAMATSVTGPFYVFSQPGVMWKFGMRLRAFKRRFKKAAGDTPLVYLNRFRVEAAKGLLETSGPNFAVITFQVGYSETI
jgi:Helix-turn-helix domain